MNGDDVALIRKDLQHLGTLFHELRQEFRDCYRDDDKRLKEVENHVLISDVQQKSHDREHKRISTALGQLREENADIARAVSELRGDLKKWSAIGGMASAGGITAILEGLSRIVK